MYDVKSVSRRDFMYSNNRNTLRRVVLGLSQDGFENLSVNSLKGDLSNATTFNPPLFSSVNNFKMFQRMVELCEKSYYVEFFW